MTWERLQAVEFSFLTLADSGAFLTHAPDKLSETLAIIRPFQWEVNITLFLFGELVISKNLSSYQHYENHYEKFQEFD